MGIQYVWACHQMKLILKNACYDYFYLYPPSLCPLRRTAMRKSFMQTGHTSSQQAIELLDDGQTTKWDLAHLKPTGDPAELCLKSVRWECLRGSSWVDKCSLLEYNDCIEISTEKLLGLNSCLHFFSDSKTSCDVFTYSLLTTEQSKCCRWDEEWRHHLSVPKDCNSFTDCIRNNYYISRHISSAPACSSTLQLNN